MENTNVKRRKKKTDTHKMVSLITAIVFFVFIIIADLALIFSHSRSFSETENRSLQQAPELNFSRLTSGKFMEQFEDFVADQFFMRDGWIGARLTMDKLSGRKESNNVLLGKKGYLLENTVTPDFDLVDKSVNALNKFSSNYPDLDIVMTIVPNAVYSLEKYVPKGALIRDQAVDIAYTSSALSDNIDFVNLNEVMRSHSDEYIYYKSDHHWTSLGAKYAFINLAPALLITSADPGYDVMTVATDFSGTMASTSGSFGTTDEVQIYVADNTPDYYVEYSGTKEPVKNASIYSSAALEQKNKYEVFFGGNFPKITISTLNNNGRNLLLLKDSYANSIVQFLLPYYEKIVMIDPRYYSDDLDNDIAVNGITDVLILYNENTFVTDSSLAGVLDPVI